MRTQFVFHLATVFAVIFCLSLIPLVGQASDSNQTLQQFSQSVEDIVREVTPSIVKIKVDSTHKPKAREKQYFKNLPDWRDNDWERNSKPEQFRFFFKSPEKDEDGSQQGSEIPPEIRRFLRQKDWKDLPQMERVPTPYIYPYGDYRQRGLGLGAGIIVNTDGYIVTVNHLVEKADEIEVTLSDGRKFDAELTGSDLKTGIAVIKIEADELIPATPGDSEQLSIGEIVIAIGHSYGFDNTASLGMVSGLGRNLNITEYDSLIQTDAVMNRGSSGGALVNTSGEIVGMNIAIFAESEGFQGISFAIPINTVKRIQEQLIERGKVVRGWLGVYIQTVSPELAEKFKLEKPHGIIVTNVIDDSRAANAGIEDNDVIIDFDGKSVKDVTHLRHLVADTQPGKTVVVTVIRDGEKQDIEVIIDEMPTDVTRTTKSRQPSRIEKGRLGVVVQDVDKDIAEKFMLAEPKGALISHVADDSPAGKAGIKEGDIIVAFDGKKIEN